MNPRIPVLGAGLLGASGVAAGAFGAHALRAFLMERGTFETWQTGAHYQLIHAVALLALGGWLRADPGMVGRGRWICWCWVIGACLFSGSLYLLATGAPRWVGPITPAGGILLLVGWILVVVAAWPRAGER